MPSVLFVCTGNLHRSPMAELLFRAKIAHNNLAWRIASAGTWAANGQPTNREVILVMQELGLDASTHSSQSVSRELMEQYRLILVMAANHKEALCAEFPDLAGRIYLLSEMVGRKADIEDPIGGPLIEYRATASEIDSYLTDGFERIVELAGV
jgi:protein-tyrosine-phosphatase